MKHGLLNSAILILCLLGISVAVTKFLEVWLRDDQKKSLREKFELWWLTVSDYDRLKLALVCVQAYNRFNDLIFGNKLFSKKAFFRCSVIATGLLFGSLALTGLLNHRLMAVAPWESYQQSCAVMNSLADLMANNERPLLDSVTNSATRSSTFTNQLAGFPTIFIFVSTNSSGDDGTVLVSYSFGKKSSDLDTNLTQAQQWSKDLATIRTGVEKYNTAEYATLYSIGYFTVLISANVALCFLATVLSRIILREICASARVVSTLSLLISNFFSTFFVSSFFLIALLGFSIPVSWLLLPLFPIIAKQSLLTFILVVYGASFGIWAINYVPLNVIIVITFLPSIFAIFATFISFVLIIGRNFLHKFVSSVLLRCAEKSPITVIGACFALLIAIVTALTQLMRGSF